MSTPNKKTLNKKKEAQKRFFHFVQAETGNRTQVLASTYKEAAQALANATGSWVYDAPVGCKHREYFGY